MKKLAKYLLLLLFAVLILFVIYGQKNFSQCISTNSLQGKTPFYSKDLAITILPFGKFEEQLVSEVKTGLIKLYGEIPVTVLSGEKLPEEAYYPPRKRYRAEKLLGYLRSRKAGNNGKIIGLTFVDISTTKGKYPDWGIFGLGSIGGQPCVVSTFRLKGKATKELLAERLVKVVNHEVGHTLGLVHCSTKGCLMEAAKGKISTVDNGSGLLCKSCQLWLNQRGWNVKCTGSVN